MHRTPDTYGVCDADETHTDVSKTLRGAKCYATRNGYSLVSVRFGCSFNAQILEEKINGKWVDYEC